MQLVTACPLGVPGNALATWAENTWHKAAKYAGCLIWNQGQALAGELEHACNGRTRAEPEPFFC